MGKLSSRLSSSIEAFLEYREALVYSTKHFADILGNLDRFVSSKHPDSNVLTREIVIGWLDIQSGDLNKKASCIRLFSEYLNSVGSQAYVLPRKIAGTPKHSAAPPYMFSGNELSRLFAAIDSFPQNRYEPFIIHLLPENFMMTPRINWEELHAIVPEVVQW